MTAFDRPQPPTRRTADQRAHDSRFHDTKFALVLAGAPGPFCSTMSIPDNTREPEHQHVPSEPQVLAELTEIEVLRRRVRVLEVGAWVERAMLLLVILVTFPRPDAWTLVLIGGPVVVLFAIYVFIQRVGTKS